MSNGTRPSRALIPWLALSIAAHAALFSAQEPRVEQGTRNFRAGALEVRLLGQAPRVSTALRAPMLAPTPVTAAPTQTPAVPATAQAPSSPETLPAAAPPPVELAATTAWTEAGAEAGAARQHYKVGTAASDSPPATDWNELTALLRTAIDHRKRYPQGALMLGREGTARVDFRLNPVGGIDDVSIISSSGIHALDLAASQAVQGIAPFTEARHYLVSAQHFQVDVVFSLD